jgi:hypothetical protein
MSRLSPPANLREGQDRSAATLARAAGRKVELGAVLHGDRPSSPTASAPQAMPCASAASSSSATMLVILIIGFTAGPAVSL